MMSDSSDSLTTDQSLSSILQGLKAIKVDGPTIERALPILIAGLDGLKQGDMDAEAWHNVEAVFQFCADSARKEVARGPIGNSPMIECILSILILEHAEHRQVDVQAMRTFANICVDHPENREKILKQGGFEAIARVLKESKHPDVTKNACGAFLNTTMDYEPGQRKVIELGVMGQLLNVLQTASLAEEEISIMIAARVLANLSDVDIGYKAVSEGPGDGIRTVIGLLSKICKNADEYLDLMDALADILRAISGYESVQTFTCQQNLVMPLLQILEDAETTNDGKTPEEIKQDDKKLGETKAALIEFVVCITLADANMVPIFDNQEVMNTFLRWLEISDREDLQTCGALCIGNVARSDSHCVKLVHEYQATEPLISVVRKAKDLKASHAATGVLRNLALPLKNKDVLGNAGVIQACFPLLKKDNALPLQSNIVGILKRLALNDSHNTIRLITGREPFETITAPSPDVETPLSLLSELVERTDDFAVKSEGTRTLCNLVKVTWGEGMQEFDTASVQILKSTLNTVDVVLPIAIMTRNPKFVVLQNEGLIAMTLLVTSTNESTEGEESINVVLESLLSPAVTAQPDAENTISEDSLDPTTKEAKPAAIPMTLLESVIEMISNTTNKYANEIRTNACIFLKTAIDAAVRLDQKSATPTKVKALKDLGVQEKLTAVLTDGLKLDDKSQPKVHPIVQTAIKDVLSRLE